MPSHFRLTYHPSNHFSVPGRAELVVDHRHAHVAMFADERFKSLNEGVVLCILALKRLDEAVRPNELNQARILECSVLLLVVNEDCLSLDAMHAMHPQRIGVHRCEVVSVGQHPLAGRICILMRANVVLHVCDVFCNVVLNARQTLILDALVALQFLDVFAYNDAEMPSKTAANSKM